LYLKITELELVEQERSQNHHCGQIVRMTRLFGVFYQFVENEAVRIPNYVEPRCISDGRNDTNRVSVMDRLGHAVG
jgi:hypothetical protein